MKTVLVVGMHRSATSLVAKGLHEAGCPMGDMLLGASVSNPHGHFEDRPAIAVNDKILEACGGTWDDPPDDIPPDTCAAEVAGYIDGRSDRDLWGVKDPRLALTWPVWLPQLTHADLHVVAVWRHPEQVAMSLEARDGFDGGVELARIYQASMRRLLEEVDGG